MSVPVFSIGNVIDKKYVVSGVCSTAGGMGTLLFVAPLHTRFEFDVVLKYCKDASEEVIQRFRREVRMLGEYRGNSKFAEIVDQNVDHEPPYFVMRLYPDGDLSKVAAKLQRDIDFQEKTFIQMIDCLAELHADGKFHRDVKPQNFLMHGENVVVSDFGLSKEFDSETVGTRSSQWWGTPAYMPPENYAGGFKNFTAASDIFMLGKTFYALLSGRDPMFLESHGIPTPVFTVIERCCEQRAENRYQDLATVKQRLTAAYDVLLNRRTGVGLAAQLLEQIKDALNSGESVDGQVVVQFIEAVAMLEENERTQVLFELEPKLIRTFTHPAVQPHVPRFLRVYMEMVESATYGFSYAEVIADNMDVLFRSKGVSDFDKTKALEVAIVAAARQNRFAAMDTCIAMIKSVNNEDLGYRVGEMLMRHPEYFIENIEPSACHSDAVIAAIKRLNEAASTSEEEGGGPSLG